METVKTSMQKVSAPGHCYCGDVLLVFRKIRLKSDFAFQQQKEGEAPRK